MGQIGMLIVVHRYLELGSVSNQADGEPELLVCLFHRAALLLPRGKTLPEMRCLETHVLQGGNGQRRAPTGGAVKDEFFLLTEDILEVGAVWIDPEFDHATRCMEATGDKTATLTLTHISNVDYHDIGIVEHANKIGSFNFFDAFSCCSNHVG